jgi:nicotinamidase/pyrazinamidase
MSKILKVHLLVIDPQNDFMGNDDGTPLVETIDTGKVHTASLPVKGAVSDMKRVAKMIDRIGHKLDDIHVTLDSHRRIDIAHPGFWTDTKGKKPSPFTIIRSIDIESGLWTPRNPALRDRALSYARTLENGGKYLLMIWPVHCEIGTWGHNVQEDLNEALQRWSEKQFALVDYVTKGSNPFTEHYGALMAEVPEAGDPGTQLNTSVLQMLAEADKIGIVGEASSHCVLTTVNQIAEHIGAEHLKKFELLTDCMSPVGHAPGGPDFPAIASAWLRDMERLGMTLTTSKDFLA